jgi:endoglucanase
MRKLVQELAEICGPAGAEQAIRDRIAAELHGVGDETRVDALGNLILRKGTRTNGGRRVMVVAHMDENGFMVTHVDEKGFVHFSPLGAVRPQTCYGSRVRFSNGTVGVIGSERLESAEKLPAFDQMFIDVGAASRTECPVRVGDVAAFDRQGMDCGDYLVGKALDNRAGAAILIEALRGIEDSPHELYFVFSVQEGLDGRGAVTAAYAVDPDLALVVDATFCGDTPKDSRLETALGNGPVIKLRDRLQPCHPAVVKWMISGAENAGLPFQVEAIEAGGLEARQIQQTRVGVPAGTLAFPCRYLHTPSEMAAESDLQNTVRLLVALLTQPVVFP